MSAAKYNLLIEQGATFKKTITLKDKEGTAIDLTGCQIDSYCKKKDTDIDPLFIFTVVLEDLANGKFSLNLDKWQTELLDFKTAVYDIEILFPDATSIRVLKGNVVFSRGVTQ